MEYNPSYDQYLLQMGIPPEQQQFMPLTNNMPWNISMVPWSGNDMRDRVMEFKGGSTPSTSNALPELVKSSLHCKRKSDDAYPIPSKHLITEEKMVAHLNGLHISKDFTSHEPESTSTLSSMDKKAKDQQSIVVPMSMTQEELEEKLRNAQSITVCEQVRQLGSDPVIPQVLLDRMQKPCTALVMWQPPKNLLNVFNNVMDNVKTKNKDNYKGNSGKTSDDKNTIDDDEIEDIEDMTLDVDNNNSSSVDLNNFMDLDMM